METWAILALIYPVMFAFANLIDKFLVDKRIKNCFSLCLLFSFTAFLAAVIAVWFVPFSGVGMKVAIIGLFSGVLLSLALFFYFYTLSFEDVSRIVSIAYITPVFVLIFAVVFLGESLPLYKIWAILAATTGAILIGMEWTKLRFRRGFWFILLSCVLWATISTIEKYLLDSVSFWNVFALGGFGAAAGFSLAVFSKHARAHFKQALRSFHYVMLTEIVSMAGTLAMLAAMAKTEVSKVSAMGSIQPLYVLIMMLMLSMFMPNVLKEVFTKRTLGIKVVSVILIVVGAYYIAL